MKRQCAKLQLGGTGAKQINNAISAANGVIGDKLFSVEVRYLGPYLHNDNTYARELDRRIKNLKVIFRMWNKFWTA